MIDIFGLDGEYTGTAARIIDLANPGEPEPETGGFAPDAPQSLAEFRATARHFIIGHTADVDDPDAPVVVREQDTGLAAMSFAEGRCPCCLARPSVGRMGVDVLMVLEHQPGCRILRALLVAAGRS